MQHTAVLYCIIRVIQKKIISDRGVDEWGCVCGCNDTEMKESSPTDSLSLLLSRPTSRCVRFEAVEEESGR